MIEIVAEDRGGTWRAVYTVRGSDLRFARFPEEIEERHRDIYQGHEPDPPAAD